MEQSSRQIRYLYGMIPDRSRTVAFTGRRSYRDQAAELLPVTLDALYRRGYRRFLNGMAAGFDLAAAEAVLNFQAVRPDVDLVCVVPFPDHPCRFSATDRARYDAVLSRAAEVIYTGERYTPDCYARRNDFLVDHASYVVAYFEGTPSGGTYYTVRRAHRQHLPVENLFPDNQLVFDFEG